MQVVPSPGPAGTQYASLAGIAANSRHDVWAVGSFTTSNGSSQTLIEHWNGAHLRIVSSPNPQGSRGSFLTAVTSVSKNDVWAVGVNNASDGTTDTLIEHWNGQNWQIVSSPNAGTNSFLEAVSAVSKNDVRAVGYYYNGSLEMAVTERWNGHSWHVVATPASSRNDFLMAVSAVAHNDVWAVGSSLASQGDVYTSLIERWNGHAWSIVSSPNPNGSTNTGLNAVSGRSHKNARAVGSSYGQGLFITLAEHWNGHAWSVVSSPTP